MGNAEKHLAVKPFTVILPRRVCPQVPLVQVLIQVCYIQVIQAILNRVPKQPVSYLVPPPLLIVCLAYPRLLLTSRNSTLYSVSTSSNFDTSFPAFRNWSRRQCSSSSLVVLMLQVPQCPWSKVSYSFFLYFCILPSFLYHLAFLSFRLLAPLPPGTPRRWAPLPSGLFANGPP